MIMRILVIANKWFEVDPLVAVLSNAQARPSDIRDFRIVTWPSEISGVPPGDEKPRACVAVAGNKVDIWCIQDLMNPAVQGEYSNTKEKADCLKRLFSSTIAPNLVIAFGTAATEIADGPLNGSVTIGTRIFAHDPYASNPGQSPSQWSDAGRMDKVIPSTFPATFFDGLSRFTSPLQDIHARLLMPFGLPAPDRMVFAERLGVAVSSVNVVDPAQYPATDPAALNAAHQAGALPIVSLESTHAVIRLASDAPFLFVSGITNRVGHFADENQAYPYTQNFVAAHNAGIAVAWLLPLMVQSLVSVSR
jgi:hypothetical protein